MDNEVLELVELEDGSIVLRTKENNAELMTMTLDEELLKEAGLTPIAVARVMVEAGVTLVAESTFMKIQEKIKETIVH